MLISLHKQATTTPKITPLATRRDCSHEQNGDDRLHRLHRDRQAVDQGRRAIRKRKPGEDGVEPGPKREPVPRLSALAGVCTEDVRRDQIEERLMKLSARNRLKGKVLGLDKGAVRRTEVEVGSGTVITATITNAAVSELGLDEGSNVYAVIKASDVMVGIE